MGEIKTIYWDLKDTPIPKKGQIITNFHNEPFKVLLVEKVYEIILEKV